MHEQVFFSRSMVSVQGLRLQGSKHAMFSGWNTKIVSFLLEKKRYKLSFYHMFQNPNISIKFPSSILKITVPADKTNTTWRSQYSVKNTIHIKICTRIHFLYSHVQSSDHCQRTPCHCELTQEKIAHLPNYIRCPRETQWTKSEIEALTSHQQSQLNTVFPKQPFLGVIFLTLSWRNWNVPGEMWALSIAFTFGALSIDIGGDKACCIPQIARGRIYISDL